MNIEGARVLLTGATGGIGRELAKRLADRQARLVLVGRNRDALSAICAETGAQALSFDLGADRDFESLAADAVRRLGGIDLLINNAGESAFGFLDGQDPEQIERILHINLLAPMLLTRALLPRLRGGARVVNIGSVFGAIGFPCNAAYSASKFGLRGFSESLRRELREREIGVTYVAPRATRTAMNSPAMYRFADRTGMKFDSASAAAREIIDAIRRDEAEYTIGAPEAFFSRLNAVLPRLVDRALRGQSRAAREVLAEASEVPGR